MVTFGQDYNRIIISGYRYQQKSYSKYIFTNNIAASQPTANSLWISEFRELVNKWRYLSSWLVGQLVKYPSRPAPGKDGTTLRGQQYIWIIMGCRKRHSNVLPPYNGLIHLFLQSANSHHNTTHKSVSLCKRQQVVVVTFKQRNSTGQKYCFYSLHLSNHWKLGPIQH